MLSPIMMDGTHIVDIGKDKDFAFEERMISIPEIALD